jgi:hypothetical protein
LQIVLFDPLVAGDAARHQRDLAPGRVGPDGFTVDCYFGACERTRLLTDERGDPDRVRLRKAADAEILV